MRALTQATANALKPISTADTLLIDSNDPQYFNVKLLDRYGTRYNFDPWSIKNLNQRLPERKQLEDRSWRYAATDFTTNVIAHAWPREQIQLTDEAKSIFTYWLSVTQRSEDNADKYAAYKDAGQVPAHSLRMHEDLSLSGYQQVACLNSMHSPGYTLFMEQGTGKTPVVVVRVDNCALKHDSVYRTLIVCPSNVRANWEREFEKFSIVKGKVTILRGGQLKRLDLLLDSLRTEPDDQYSVVICSYDVMIQSFDAINLIGSQKGWDLGVLDEGHYIKSPRAKRTKYAHMLRDVTSSRMLLTGTPVSNSILDLYSQLEFIGEGFSGFRSHKEFKKFYGVFADTGGDGHSKLVGIQNLPFMKERLARYSFMIRKAEALPDLPDKVYDFEEATMSAKQADVYESVTTHMMAEIESMLDGENKQLVVNNVLTKLLKLAQICSGFITYPEECDQHGNVIQERSTERFSPIPKLDRLEEIVNEHLNNDPNSKLIIWACWVNDIEAIVERLSKSWNLVHFYGGTSEKQRQDAEYLFNHDANTRVFVGNPSAGGTGLNLLGYPPGEEDFITNCDRVIYYSQDWSMVNRSQSEDRCHRRGTRSNVRITDLMVPNTIDQEIRSRVLSKRMNALEIADIRNILNTLMTGVITS